MHDVRDSAAYSSVRSIGDSTDYGSTSQRIFQLSGLVLDPLIWGNSILSQKHIVGTDVFMNAEISHQEG